MRFGCPNRSAGRMTWSTLVAFHRLWMPGAHTPETLRSLWRGPQSEPGFSRQREIAIGRARDSIAVVTLDVLRRR